MTAPLLRIDKLSVAYGDGFTALRGVQLQIAPGECLAVVGPSGSGKSTLARAILGLLPAGATITGHIDFSGADLAALDEAAMRPLRGRRIGYVAQDPYQACNPLRPVHDHVADAWRVHGLAPPDAMVARRLADAGIAGAETAMWQYPHQWSGGMLQRASIGAATAHAPSLLIADEPTSALDADRADAILAMLKARGSAILLISHDLDLVLRHADRIALCEAGALVETASPAGLAASHRPATRALFGAALLQLPRRAAPAAAETMVELAGVSRQFRVGRGHRAVLADIDLSLHAGEVVGIAGPSGCGKSTLLRLIGGLDRPDAGRIARHKALARPGAVMPIFQDPVASLNARWPIWKSLVEPLTASHLPALRRSELLERAHAVLERIGLAAIDIDSRPGELSSGQCQRISVARALIAGPRLVLADEPTSALDTLSRHQVLALLAEAAASGTAIAMVSHDRQMLARFADRSLVYADGGFIAAA
jgi:peptide/nickel transport system ATP-binding protein